MRMAFWKKQQVGDQPQPMDTMHEAGTAAQPTPMTAQSPLASETGMPAPAEALPSPESHVDRMLAAAKDPQLAMKLRNMPVPLEARQVDEYLGPVLESAVTGDLDLIPAVGRSA